MNDDANLQNDASIGDVLGEDLPEIEYRHILGFTGYRIGNDGSVWSRWEYRGHKWTLGDVWRRRKPQTEHTGYLCVRLRSDSGQWATRKIHRLVLQEFVGACPPGMECLHRNHVRSDNRLSNIRWGTRAENAAERVARGTHVNQRGEKNSQAKLSDPIILAMRRRRAEGATFSMLSLEFDTSLSNAWSVCSGGRWKHVAAAS